MQPSSSFLFLLLSVLAHLVNSQNISFSITDFSSKDLLVLGNTLVQADGSLHMTYDSSGDDGPYFISRVLYSSPVLMHNLSRGEAASFSSSFTFSIPSNQTNISADGMTFIIAPTNLLPQTRFATGSAMGVYDVDRYGPGNASLLHFVAVEYDTFLNLEYNDPDDHHIGLDINSLSSVKFQSLPPELALKTTNFSRRLTTWIDYDALKRQLDVFVALAPAQRTSASKILSVSNLSMWDHVLGHSYVGFTASTGLLAERHSVYAWNFSSKIVSVPIPPPPLLEAAGKSQRRPLVYGLSAGCGVILLISILLAVWIWKKRTMMSGVTLDVDLMSVPRKFTLKELIIATRDFKEILGHGGSGNVYKGVVTTSHAGAKHLAVKKISKVSKQGEREFKTEVLTIGRIRHRNVVHLYGWCCEKGELLLVYQFMPNGSLEKHLHHNVGSAGLSWELRFNILRGVASALVYLHVDCEKSIIHRDIKASNVLLDSDLNARLGDFGLARCFDHDDYRTESSASGIAGTWGYMAPEYALSGRVTREADIFSFGVLALEIACGRRPFPSAEETLIDYVWEKHEDGQLISAADERLHGQFDVDEMRRMLHVGILCTHPDPKSRPPSMRVLQLLNGDAELPELPVSRPSAIYVQVETSKVYKSGILTSKYSLKDTTSTLSNDTTSTVELSGST